MRFLLVSTALLFAMPAFAQSAPAAPAETQDWQGMAASLNQQLMDAIAARMQHDAQMLRQLQAASAEAATAKAKVAELEKKLGAPKAPAKE